MKSMKSIYDKYYKTTLRLYAEPIHSYGTGSFLIKMLSVRRCLSPENRMEIRSRSHNPGLMRYRTHHPIMETQVLVLQIFNIIFRREQNKIS